MISRRATSTAHILIAVFQFVYIYTPLHDWSYGLAIVQWLTFPLLVLTGSWLVVGRWIYGARRGAAPAKAPL